MIEVCKLIKRFGHKPVLKGVDFRAERGEFVVLLGPNGAGKTTFLRILASLSGPSSGEVRIAGYGLPRMSETVRRIVGFVSHQPLLYGDLTAEENLRFYSRLYGMDKCKTRIAELLALVGLDGCGRDLVRNYSRGMQQRLAISRAILHDPELLLLDEPYTGLDQKAEIILDRVLQEMMSRGRTIVMASHNLERGVKLASRIDILAHGVIDYSKSRDKLDADMLAALYREIIGAENSGLS